MALDDVDEHEGGLERRLVDARPEGDDVTRAVWRARVTSALFGDAEPVTIGRYQLQRQLGRGGGGSVYVATDPELHREVAVKLIRCASARHRERALAEGRALARLSHPNVVPVHDVGDAGDRVYLVMELLRGRSLRDHASECTVRELVGAYRQAAAGLAAAHAAGLVHRDFKPDNAVFGDDGRLRVVDFGLASSGDAAGAVGTPGYMAPELGEPGATPGPAVDQYALGVALREALAERSRGEPAWLARVIDRATAARPEDRYPSMEALADALGADPVARWKRRVLIAAPVVLAGLGFWLGRGATVGVAERCAGGGEALASAWTVARGAAIVEHVGALATPLAMATAPRVRDRLDQLSRTWLTAHRQSCMAHARAELPDELYDRAAVCLARSRLGFGQAMELLGAAASDAALDKAVESLSVIDSAERCADPAALADEASPQPTIAMRMIDQQIEIAAFHARAATPQAVQLAEMMVAAARTQGDSGLVARALLVLGHAYLSDATTQPRAVAPLHEAMLLALGGGRDDIMVEAYARHAYALARTATDPLRALDGLELARVIGVRAGPRGAFARALLSNNVGAIAALAGDFERARREFRQALKDREAVTGPGTVELVTTVSNLAMLSPDREDRRRLFATAVDQSSAAVGPDARQALRQQLQAISDRDDPGAVLADLPALCRRFAELHPNLVGMGRRCWFEVAWQAVALGARSVARDAAQALSSSPRTDFESRLLEVYTTLAGAGPSKQMVTDLEQLGREQAGKVAQLGWYQNVYAADARLALAAVASAMADHALARKAAAQAAEHLERWAAATGVAGGLALRRSAWARRLQHSGER
jgi:eukaryotic-like serine/threonine-protein kinase